MFGIDDAAVAAGIGAVGQFAGGMISSSGQAATNAQQLAYANQQYDQQQNYNLGQAEWNRRFSSEQSQNQMTFQSQMQGQAQEFNASQAELNRIFQAGSQQKAMDWMGGMSGTAYQRAMADMKAAGLNPILAANLGGASTPSIGGMSGASASIHGASGASASAPAPGGGSSSLGNLSNPSAALGHGIASAAQLGQRIADYKLTTQQVEQSKSQVDLNKANETQAETVSAVNRSLKYLKDQETVTSARQADQLDASSRAHDASAAASMSTAAYNSQATVNAKIDAITKAHDANTAYERFRQEKRRADDVEAAGTGFIGEGGAAIGRIYSSGIGYLKGLVGNVVDALPQIGPGNPAGVPRGSTEGSLHINIDKPVRR